MKTLYIKVRFALFVLLAMLIMVFWIWPIEAFYRIRGEQE